MANLTLAYTSFFLVEYFQSIGMWLVVVTGFFAGVLGEFSIATSAVMAYLADATEETARSDLFITVQAFNFAAISFGPIVGGFIARNFQRGALYLFGLSVCISSFIIVCCALWLPESLPVSKPEHTEEEK